MQPSRLSRSQLPEHRRLESRLRPDPLNLRFRKSFSPCLKPGGGGVNSSVHSLVRCCCGLTSISCQFIDQHVTKLSLIAASEKQKPKTKTKLPSSQSEEGSFCYNLRFLNSTQTRT